MSRLDRIELRILEALHEDARLPMAGLARRVHLSRTASLARVQHLEAKGVIAGYHPADHIRPLSHWYKPGLVMRQEILSQTCRTLQTIPDQSHHPGLFAIHPTPQLQVPCKLLIYKDIFQNIRTKARKKPGPYGTGLLSFMVGVAGFELATPCTPCKCATRLRYTPTSFKLYTETFSAQGK